MALRLRDKQRAACIWSLCFSLFIVIYLVFSTTAFATGWMYISKTSKPLAGKWSKDKSPHGNFSPTSNKCRVCHALHKANQDSYRLLFDNSRLTSCDRCHDPVTGLSGKKPYKLDSTYMRTRGLRNYNRSDSGKFEKPRITRISAILPEPTPVSNAKGEHTPGVSVIPESNINLPQSFSPDGLNCYSCHDPHFVPANTIQSIPKWNYRGLLKDPGENGGSADDGLSSVQPYSANNKPISSPSLNPSVGEVKSAFCADCHNKNASWDKGLNERTNKHTHPFGNVDGKVDVYGLQKKVAETMATSCLSCHLATTETDDNGNPLGPSSFPHQSVGHKLFSDTYTTASTVPGFDYTGSPNRTLPNLDAGVCRKCHTKIGQGSVEGF